MWKLATYVTCVVILFPNIYGHVDYTSYLLSRLTEHVNEVNSLLKMIYKQRDQQIQIDGGDLSEVDGLEQDYMYDHVLWQTISALKNAYRTIMRFKSIKMSPLYAEPILFPNRKPASYDTHDTMDLSPLGRRSASLESRGDWSDNFYEALATSFKSFLAHNPEVRSQLGDDFNADALINPPNPKKR